MVKLHVKRGDESQFLFETTVEIPLSELLPQLVSLYNGRLKVERLCQGRSARPLYSVGCVHSPVSRRVGAAGGPWGDATTQYAGPDRGTGGGTAPQG